MRVLSTSVICIESVGILGELSVESRCKCVRVLWAKRAQHKIGSLSTHRAEIFPYPDIKNLVETSAILQSSLVSLIEISLRDLIIKSSRDTHHHSASHILYVYQKLVEILSMDLVETCHHMHTHIASRRDICYHMYIHFEIHTLSCISVHTRSRQILNVGTI